MRLDILERDATSHGIVKAEFSLPLPRLLHCVVVVTTIPDLKPIEKLRKTSRSLVPDTVKIYQMNLFPETEQTQS